MENIFSSLDGHCDGKVNYSEFLAATMSSINFNKEEKLWSAFKYFDTTDSGFITLDSIIDALKESGVVVDEEGLHDTFKEMEKQGKKINFEEFRSIAFNSFEDMEGKKCESKKSIEYEEFKEMNDNIKSVTTLSNKTIQKEYVLYLKKSKTMKFDQ